MKSKGKGRGILRWGTGTCLAIAMCAASGGIAASQEPSFSTPRQVVEQWFEVYPGNIERAAELTTTAFREGVSKEEWIAIRGPYLRGLQLKYVRAKIAHEKMVGEEAHVIVHAHIVTLMGDQPQDELYILLKNPDGRWAIDQVEVYTESFNAGP
ncbi:MAG: hypothetical protein NPIRA03_04670 [Nitrospirales bacterium]|nr:MAG: hypothetical protein NPIRA03_04670 [Nitrospirales bacterium]